MKYKFILVLLLIIAIVNIIILYFFENLRVPVLFNIDSSKINSLVEVLSLAYISSYIFYFLVVLLKEKSDKKIIYPFIADYTYVMMNNCVHFCVSMRHWANMADIVYKTGIHDRNLSVYPTLEELTSICKTIDPNKEIKPTSSLPGFHTIPHFFGIMIHFALRIDYFLDILLTKSSFLDTELLRIITDIKTSGYHQDIISYGRNGILTAKHRKNNLGVYKKSFEYYFNLFIRLEKYADKHLKKYVERDSLLAKN